MRASFLEKGGVIYEGAAFSKAEVFTDAVLVRWTALPFAAHCWHIP